MSMLGTIEDLSRDRTAGGVISPYSLRDTGPDDMTEGKALSGGVLHLLRFKLEDAR